MLLFLFTCVRFYAFYACKIFLKKKKKSKIGPDNLHHPTTTLSYKIKRNYMNIIYIYILIALRFSNLICESQKSDNIVLIRMKIKTMCLTKKLF